MLDLKERTLVPPELMATDGHEKSGTFTTPKDVIEFAKREKLQIADFKFVDLFGTWQHFSVPVTELSEDVFTEGAGFDGSSIRGFQQIDESDMMLVLDPASAVRDPICAVPTLSLVGNIVDPITRQPYTRDPRFIAQKAERYLKDSGVATVSYWGPEAEFFIFDNIRFDQDSHSGYYYVDADEGVWNSGLDHGTKNLGYRPRVKEGYFPVAPTDSLQDLRSEIILRLINAGVPVEVHHHEVGGAGQCEIDMRYNSLTSMGDSVMMYKYIVKNVARAHGKTATFMPKPIFQDNGSGMHVHQSLWIDGRNLFADPDGYAGLSQLALWYIGGLLKHSAALLAFCAPTTNSYRRLIPGYEAPVNLVYSRRNRSAAVRIPMYSTNPKAKRIEYRPPDPTANAYIAMAALLMAGLDGIENKIDPGSPMDVDLYELPEHEARQVKQVPDSLDKALLALEADHEFLLKGDVFTKDLIETWVSYKRKKEVDAVRLRPHPYEFYMYYDS